MIQSSQFNRATAHSNTEQILLNSARASKGFPLQFTRLSKYTGKEMVSGSVSPSFPIGRDAAHIFKISPKLNFQNGVSSIEYGDLNTKDTLKALNTPTNYRALDSIVTTNPSVNVRMLFTLTVSGIQISDPIMKKVAVVATRQCKHNGKESKKKRHSQCDYIDHVKTQCPDISATNLAKNVRASKEGPYFVGVNSARSKCDFLTFQALITYIGMVGYSTDVITTTKYVIATDLNTGKKTRQKISEPNAIGFFTNPSIRDIETSEEARLKGTGYSAVKIYFRSPKSMIEYLGELIRLQNFHSDRYVPKIPKWISSRSSPFELVELASIRASTRFSGASAMQVRDDEGQLFSVPRPEYGSETAHLTLSMLAQISDFVSIAISKDDLPASSNVILSN